MPLIPEFFRERLVLYVSKPFSFPKTGLQKMCKTYSLCLEDDLGKRLAHHLDRIFLKIKVDHPIGRTISIQKVLQRIRGLHNFFCMKRLKTLNSFKKPQNES